MPTRAARRVTSTTSTGSGYAWWGISAAGLPSSAQLASLRRLVDELAAQYNIPAENVIGHRDAPNAATECPGNALERYIVKSLRPTVSRGYAYHR